MKLFFDIVEDRFFYPLTNKNRRLYEEVIFKLFSWVEELDESDENDRVIITTRLESYLDNRLLSEVYDEDGNLITGDNWQKAQYMIRYLIDCRWIFEEPMGDKRFSLNFYDHSYQVIAMMKNVRSESPKTYDNELRNILNTLEVGQQSNYDDFKYIHDSVLSLSNMLKSLRSNINQYYINAISNKSNEELKDIISNFNEYKIEFFDKSYFKFKTDTDANNTIVYVISELEKAYSFNFEQLIPSYRELVNKVKTDEEIIIELEENYSLMMRNLRGLSTVIKNIEDKNNKYISSLLNKIYYLINRGTDIRGILNETISQTISDEIKDYSFININEQFRYTLDNMYYPKQRREVIKTVFMREHIELSEKEQQELYDEITSSFKYSIENINDYVMNLLNEQDEIPATVIEFEDEHDYVKLLLVAIYGFINETDYTVTLTGQKGYIDNIEFDNYIIKRKDVIKWWIQ